VRQIIILLVFSISTLSCADYYYTGDTQQDSIIKSVDKKLSHRKNNWVWSQMLRPGDSIIRYASYKGSNELVILHLAENNREKSSFYNLIEGQLVKVQHFPAGTRKSNFYFFEDGKFLFKRQKVLDSIDPHKFLRDIISIKKTFSLK
jgi:hypothetical protein